jgi:hypothetical protein
MKKETSGVVVANGGVNRGMINWKINLLR